MKIINLLKNNLFIFIFVIIILNIVTISIYIKNEYVKIHLLGEIETNIKLDETYTDSGFILTKGKEIISKRKYKYKSKTNINNKKIGTYYYEYNVNYKNKNYKVKRTINVLDETKPNLAIANKEVTRDSCSGSIATTLSYTAIDNYDGDITSSVSTEENENELLLKVKDSSGNETTEKVPIINTEIKDNYISLNGNKTIYLKKNSTYTEPGYSFKDGCGNTIDSPIEVNGNVDTSTPGNYKITYTTTYNDITYTETRNVFVTAPIDGTNHTIYLTFDDGPGKYTDTLLSILDKYNVHATFFVTNQAPIYQNMIYKEYINGNKVAVHTLTHKWDIYSSLESYISDFNQMNDIIESQTGTRSNLFRFPGGSSNTVSKKYKKGIVTEIANYMTENGNIYFDWNVDSGDAAGASSSQIYENVINGIQNHKNAVVLMHDIKKNTIDTIEQIIIYGLENHYTFKVLDETSPTMHQKIAN